MSAIPGLLQRQHVIAGVLYDPRFLASYHTHLDPQYFESPEERWLVATALRYYRDYGTAPSFDALRMEIERAEASGQADAQLLTAVVILLERLPATDQPTEQHIRDYVFTHTGDFLRAQALRKAVEQTVDDLRFGRETDILQRFDQAMQVGKIDPVPTYRLFDDLDRWLRELAESEDTVIASTGIMPLDAALRGGLRAGQLGVWMAPTNRGKSHALIWCGKVAALQGKRVLHISVEMYTRDILARYAASVTGVDSLVIWEEQATVRQLIDRTRSLYEKDVLVRSYPTKGISVRGIKEVVESFGTTGQPIDVLVIDYGDELAPNYDTKEQDWIIKGQIFSDLRGLAGVLQIPVWTATQTNRSGLRADELDMATVSASFDKVMVADVVIAMNQRSVDRDVGLMTLVPVKVRTGLANKRIDVQVNWATSHISLIQDDDTPTVRGKDFLGGS